MQYGEQQLPLWRLSLMHVRTQAQYLCVEGHDEDAQVGRGDGQQRRETPGDAATPCQGTHKKGGRERKGGEGFRGGGLMREGRQTGREGKGHRGGGTSGGREGR